MIRMLQARIQMNKFAISILFYLSCTSVYGGSLYTFDKDTVQINALNWIQSRESDFAQAKLKTDRVRTNIDKSGSLITTVYFTYKTDDEHGFNYVCAKINENGELIGFERDIGVYKSKFKSYRPNHPFCKNL